MLTLDALKELGINTEEGLARCMNNETFYFRMISIGIQDANFEKLKTSVEAGSLQEGFEAAHALKGVMTNLALTNLSKPVIEITELLRGQTETDYAPLLTEIEEERGKLLALL